MTNLCDGLTLFRLFACLGLIIDGLVWGVDGARLAIILLILGNTTDILDGRIARATQKPKTKIGSNEIIFDMLLLIGAILYLGIANFIPAVISYSWAAWLLILIFWPNVPFNFFWFFETTASISALPLLILLSRDWLMLVVFLVWGIVALVWDWQRAATHAKSWKIIIQRNYKKLVN